MSVSVNGNNPHRIKDQRPKAKDRFSMAIAKATGGINEVATQALPLSAFYPQGNREQRLKFGI
jgi:hypothetical protein